MPWWVQSFPSVGRMWPSVSDLGLRQSHVMSRCTTRSIKHIYSKYYDSKNSDVLLTWWWFHLCLRWWSCRPSSRGRWCPDSDRFPGTGWSRWRWRHWDHPAAGETSVCDRQNKETEIHHVKMHIKLQKTNPTPHQLLWRESECFLVRNASWSEHKIWLDGRRTLFVCPEVLITRRRLFFMSVIQVNNVLMFMDCTTCPNGSRCWLLTCLSFSQPALQSRTLHHQKQNPTRVEAFSPNQIPH